MLLLPRFVLFIQRRLPLDTKSSRCVYMPVMNRNPSNAD